MSVLRSKWWLLPWNSTVNVVHMTHVLQYKFPVAIQKMCVSKNQKSLLFFPQLSFALVRIFKKEIHGNQRTLRSQQSNLEVWKLYLTTFSPPFITQSFCQQHFKIRFNLLTISININQELTILLFNQYFHDKISTFTTYNFFLYTFKIKTKI